MKRTLIVLSSLLALCLIGLAGATTTTFITSTNSDGLPGYGGYILDDQPTWTIYEKAHDGEDTANMISYYQTEVAL